MLRSISFSMMFCRDAHQGIGKAIILNATSNSLELVLRNRKIYCISPEFLTLKNKGKKKDS
jgi:hypothetical protein